ncbi:hypothetical protein M422DRAFT_258523 [Sphaerobolus stellatus SS14]|uniref:Uncharacterized protein n=1 Tax=Sphaerobolus stellatus (strain SS14) TaxID=990650 RepID=A0A0C9VMI9_SPHS4|nr:hypothetical protein M422DRAFT_258523 [Sphaerobolus stellatus SS14]
MTIVSNQTSHSPATGVDECAEVPDGNLEASPDTDALMQQQQYQNPISPTHSHPTKSPIPPAAVTAPSGLRL